MFQRIIKLALAHKIVSGMVLVAIIASSYFGYQSLSNNSQTTKYVLAAVEKGTIVASITGSGQVSASNQVDINPKVSGDIVYVGVKSGQEVGTGYLLAQLDTSDAQKAIRDAQISLEDAKVQLQKMELNQKNDLSKLKDNVETAQNDLIKTYDDALNTVSNVFLGLPDIIEDARIVLYGSTVGTSNQSNAGAYENLIDTRFGLDVTILINNSESDYENARTAYDQNFDDFNNLSANPSREDIERIVNQTLETARLTSKTLKNEQNLLSAVVENVRTYQGGRPIPSAITGYQTDLAQNIGQLNSYNSNLLDITNSIKSSNNSLASSLQTLEYNQQFNPLDIVAQENTIRQREATLQDAQKNLANYYIRAPFGGIVTKINVKRGDSASGGTAIATMITKQRIAELSLNEVDIAQVIVSQKATLTFDAVADLTVTGQVLEIDSLGTVSQGVVTYNVVIGFDTQEEKIKPGMSVSAAIITDSKQDVLLIPNSAIKFASGTNYVEIPADNTTASKLLASAANNIGIVLDTLPQQQTIETGLANDSVTEVIGGLKEGDIVITRTITSSSGATIQTNSSQSLFPVGGRTSVGR